MTAPCKGHLIYLGQPAMRFSFRSFILRYHLAPYSFPAIQGKTITGINQITEQGAGHTHILCCIVRKLLQQ